MIKTIKSDKYIWNEIESSWKDIGRGTGYYISAAKELANARDLINSHSDVSNLYLISSKNYFNKLDSSAEDFISFTRNVHRDFEYEVDRPFYKNIMSCVSDVYRLNPGEFVLDKTRPDMTVNRIVLTDLLGSTIEDADLRDEFEAMIEHLDEDEPSQDVKDAILASIQEYYGYDYDTYMTNSDTTVVNEYKADRDLFIDYYEEMYPDKAAVMDQLMVGLTDDIHGTYQEDVENLKFMAYKAEEPYQTLFFQYIGGMEIIDNNYTYVDPDDGKTYSSQYWSPGGNDLTLNFDPIHDNGIVDPRGPYTTFFHEIGHGVDDLSLQEATDILWYHAPDEKMVIEYRNEHGQSLNDVMILDVRERITEEIISVADSNTMTLTDNQVSVILDSLMMYNSPSKILDSSGYEDIGLTTVYKDVQTNMAKELKGAIIGGISDAYGGITNRTVQGSYGHGEDYWFRSDGSVRTYASTELYAHNFAYQMTGSVIQQEYMEKYFPRANEYMKQMAEDLYKLL